MYHITKCENPTGYRCSLETWSSRDRRCIGVRELAQGGTEVRFGFRSSNVQILRRNFGGHTSQKFRSDRITCMGHESTWSRMQASQSIRDRVRGAASQSMIGIRREGGTWQWVPWSVRLRDEGYSREIQSFKGGILATRRRSIRKS